MDTLLHALAHETRLQIVRELRHSPGLKHAELLPRIGLAKRKAGQLTKLIAPLEAAGLVRRADGQYYVVDHVATGRLLSAAADVNVSAQRILAERAQLAVRDAERLAEELQAERDSQHE
jgi:DNA-binding transcriptional ArsR family regulator